MHCNRHDYHCDYTGGSHHMSDSSADYYYGDGANAYDYEHYQ